jgi:hypothetical protein
MVSVNFIIWLSSDPFEKFADRLLPLRAFQDLEKDLIETLLVVVVFRHYEAVILCSQLLRQYRHYNRYDWTKR